MHYNKELFAIINSSLNGLSTVLLITAYVLIRRRQYRAHGWTMVCALASSATFLASYVYSKVAFGEVSTGIPAGWFRLFYWAVLFPHVLLAIGMLPMIGLAVWRAYHRQWVKHRAIARPTWFIWTYVSITGVLIYFILYQWYPALYPDAFRASKLFSGRM